MSGPRIPSGEALLTIARRHSAQIAADTRPYDAPDEPTPSALGRDIGSAYADGIAAGAPRLRSVLGRGIDAADECCGHGCARCPRTHEPPGGETRL